MSPSNNRRGTRRQLLKTGAGAALAFGLQRRIARAALSTKRETKPRPDLLDAKSPKDLEIIQLTTDPEVPSCHVYMEAQIFTPDSKRFVLQRSGHAHGSDKKDPRHQFLLCDIEDDFALHPLTDEIGATGPSISPDGKYLYYFVDETEPGSGRLTLKRVNLDGADRQTLMVVDTPLPGTKYRPSLIYPLSTISSDGKRMAISAFLGDGKTKDAPFGLMVFDLRKASVELIVQGPSWCNLHAQFSRSLDPELNRDILIQENHGCVTDERGESGPLTSGDGADIHVIRDDGTNLRDLPWGRDGNEWCQGHQCWRGRTDWAITSTGMKKPTEERIIESRPLPHVGHTGAKTPGGVRNDLSREFNNPQFCHFGVDIAGTRLISDTEPMGPKAQVYLARLGTPGEAPLTDFMCLSCPKTSGKSTAHIHPFLSPDGRMGFFNSDESGLLQAYMVRGFV